MFDSPGFHIRNMEDLQPMVRFYHSCCAFIVCCFYLLYASVFKRGVGKYFVFASPEIETFVFVINKYTHPNFQRPHFQFDTVW